MKILWITLLCLAAHPALATEGGLVPLAVSAQTPGAAQPRFMPLTQKDRATRFTQSSKPQIVRPGGMHASPVKITRLQSTEKKSAELPPSAPAPRAIDLPSSDQAEHILSLFEPETAPTPHP